MFIVGCNLKGKCAKYHSLTLCFLLFMIEILTTYDPYFAEPRALAPEQRQTMLCVEDRPPEDERIEPDLQIAGAGNGFVYDLHFALLANGIHVPMHRLTPLVAQAIGPKIAFVQHGNVCGGEAAMPSIPAEIARRDPQALINTVASFDLNVRPSVTEQMIDLAHASRRKRSVPNIEATAARQNDARASRVPVIGEHLARAVIINNTHDRFRNRAAWEDGNPALVFSAADVEDAAGNILDATAVNTEYFMAFSALRHIVTVEEKLKHPEPGEQLSILVRNPSFARG